MSEDTIQKLHPAALFDPDAHRKKRSFHRGDSVNYTPNRDDYSSKTFLQDYVLKGWTPAAPFLTRSTKITAFGSCFAANITRHLGALGYDTSAKRDPSIYVSRIGDGLVNTAAILGQFEWALDNKKQPTDLWHGYQAEGFGYDDDIRVRTRNIFLTSDVFIITLGLSEIWYDEKTGGTFWRAVPEDAFDPTRHKFRVLSMEETKADIAAMHRVIRRNVPNAKIVFTLSPIPLAATFRPVSCMAANTVSKAIIRAALDEFLRSEPGELGSSLFYFPSYEIVQFGFVDPWGDDMRHPTSYVLDTVMKIFEAAFCVGESSLEEANRVFQMFRVQNMQEISRRVADVGDVLSLIEEARGAAYSGRVARDSARAQENKLGSARGNRAEGKVKEKPLNRRQRMQLRRAKRDERGDEGADAD